MSWHRYYSFESTQAIETEAGIKAKSKRGAFVKNWWATRWISTLEKLLDAGRLRRGKSYARKGQVLSIDETKTGMKAKVQGSRSTPYTVHLEITPLTTEQWDTVITALSQQAIFTAQLLAGEMPQQIEEVFDKVGVPLFPKNKQDLTTKCSCPDYANPCKHVAAVHYLLGEQFDENPFLLFRLRGRSQEQIMEALRAKRAKSGSSGDETALPLTKPLPPADDQFWQMGQVPKGLKTDIKRPPTELPLLKRLGQPNFLSESLISLLTPAYQNVTETALDMAFKTEVETDQRDDLEEDENKATS